MEAYAAEQRGGARPPEVVQAPQQAPAAAGGGESMADYAARLRAEKEGGGTGPSTADRMAQQAAANEEAGAVGRLEGQVGTPTAHVLASIARALLLLAQRNVGQVGIPTLLLG